MCGLGCFGSNFYKGLSFVCHRLGKSTLFCGSGGFHLLRGGEEELRKVEGGDLLEQRRDLFVPLYFSGTATRRSGTER